MSTSSPKQFSYIAMSETQRKQTRKGNREYYACNKDVIASCRHAMLLERHSHPTQKIVNHSTIGITIEQPLKELKIQPLEGEKSTNT